MQIPTVAEFLAHCTIDPLEAVARLRIAIKQRGESFEIVNSYGFAGPVEFDNDPNPARTGPTKQQIAHATLLDFMQRHGFDPLVPSGVFIRWTNDIDDIERARRGELKSSISHFPGSTTVEPGVSVSRGPWIYGFSKLHCYFVQGPEVGEGTDGEPCLDGASISIYSDAKLPGELRSREWLFQQFYWRNEYRLKEVAEERSIGAATLMGFMLGGAHCDQWYPRRSSEAA